MKKLIALILVLASLALTFASCSLLPEKNEKDNTVIKIAYMNGPTGMGMAKLIHDNTDESGKTPIFNLPAPPAVLTESPENTVRPYAFYNILTEADGFIDNINYNATIFDGVTSLQNVNMVPRSKENDQPIVNDEYEEYTL